MNLFPKPGQTIASLVDEIRDGSLRARQVVDLCLQNVDQHESKVRAFVQLDREEAIRQANRLDDELRRGKWRGPLHGIPIGIKDIVDVAGLATGMGAQRWNAGPAASDATVVKRLRDAGAILFGKLVTTAYASFDPPVTTNPWNVERTTGGSSSGPAAAVASGMCFAAIASQTGGSITRPASYCGVWGFKPTYGRVSLHGVLPLAPSMDHVGPMARSVLDLTFVMDAIAGHDSSDPVSVNVPYESLAPFVSVSLSEAPKLGVLRGFFRQRASEEMNVAFESMVAGLSQAGFRIVETVLPESFDEVVEQHRIIMAVEAATFHQKRFQEIDRADYPPCVSQLIEEGLATPAVRYARAIQYQARLRRQVQACFGSADALLAPATTMAAPARATTGDPAFNSPWSLTGLPVVSFPFGLSADELPLALQLVGKPYSEARLLRVARAVETRVRQQFESAKGQSGRSST